MTLLLKVALHASRSLSILFWFSGALWTTICLILYFMLSNIPLYGVNHSLPLVVAAGIVLHEWARRRYADGATI